VLVTLVAWGGVSPLAGQQLPVKSEVPTRQLGICPAFEAADPGLVTEADRAEAARLSTSATQAAIIGDHAQARTLLLRAARLDPLDPNVAYLLARSSEEVSDREAALEHFCRFLALSPNAPEAPEVQARVAVLAPDPDSGYSEEAMRSFRLGVNNLQFGRTEPALGAFTAAIEAAPEWPEAYYNRGLTYARLNQPELASTNLERYLELAPDAEDADAVRSALGRLADPQVEFNPGSVIAAGLLPGGAHFATGRPFVGTLVLGAVGGLIAFGILSEDIVIQCRSIPVDGVCPTQDIASEERTRPYLAPALGAAGGLTVLAVWEAYRNAKGRSGDLGSLVQIRSTTDGSIRRWGMPRLTVGPTGTAVEWFRMVF